MVNNLGFSKGAVCMRKNLKEARKAAGLTQQQIADKLGIGLRYYKQIEAGDRTGDFTLWDMLEDITGIHQRKLREISDSHLDQEDNQSEH
jgi:transcriptional regulator with XRE-family HTH domain